LVKVSTASTRRSIGALALAAGLLAFASAASAVANLMDVRVGVHGDHTRLVIETDGAAPYVVDPTDREVLVHVDAASTAEAVTAKSPHLIWVKVEPSAIGTDVRIQLKQPVEVKTLVLTRPDRIVLDLYPKAGGAEPLPAPEVLPEDEALPDMAAAEPVPVPATEETPDEPGLPEEEAEPAEEPLVLALPEDATEPEADSAMEAERQAQLAGEPAPAGEPSEGIGGQGEEPKAPAEKPVRPTTPVAPAPSGSLFGSPFALGAAAVALLAVFVLLRRRMRRGETQRVSPLPEEDHAPYEPPARAVEVGEPSPTGESLFDVEPEAYAHEDREEAPLPRGMLRADADSGDENERRLAHLEKRIEELADAKDRLERQVAAQTEELRVQRAAIARTQRVLRSVAPKTDDDSSEPVRG